MFAALLVRIVQADVPVYKTHQGRGFPQLTTAIDPGTRRVRHCAAAQLFVGPSLLPKGQRLFCDLTPEDHGRHSRLVVCSVLRPIKVIIRMSDIFDGSNQLPLGTIQQPLATLHSLASTLTHCGAHLQFWHRSCHPRVGSDQVGWPSPAAERRLACGYCMHACVFGITKQLHHCMQPCMLAGQWAPLHHHSSVSQVKGSSRGKCLDRDVTGRLRLQVR